MPSGITFTNLMLDTPRDGFKKEVLRSEDTEENIGIFSINRKEWLICDLAYQLGGIRFCSLYETLGKEALLHIVNQTEMRI